MLHRRILPTLEIGIMKPEHIHDRDSLLADPLHLRLERADDGIKRIAITLQQALVVQHRPQMVACRLETLLEQLSAQRQDIRPQVPAATILDLILGELEQPIQKRLVLRAIQAEEHRVDHLAQQAILIHLDAITTLQADLAGKGPHRLLEETVDRADIKSGIIVKNGDQDLPGPTARLALIQIVSRTKLGEIIRLPARGQPIQLLHDPGLHLVGRLVREGHRQQAAVSVRPRKEQGQALACQLVGLTRPGGSPVDRQHSLSGFLDLTALRVTLGPQDLDHPRAEIALDDDLPIFHGTTDTAFHPQQLAQRRQIVGRPMKTGDERHHFPATITLVERHAQRLLLFWPSLLFRLLGSLIFKIGIGGIHHAQSLFPVVRFHFFQSFLRETKLRIYHENPYSLLMPPRLREL